MFNCKKCGRGAIGRGLVVLEDGIYCKDCGREHLIELLAKEYGEKYRNRTKGKNRIKIGELRKEIKKDPQNAENYYNLSALILPDEYRKEYHTSSDIKESNDLLLKALAVGLSDPTQRGMAYSRLAALKEGVIRKDPDDNSMVFLSVSSLGKQYLRNAEKEFRLALSYEPDNVDVLRQLQVIYRTLEKDDEQGEILARLEEVKTRKSIGLPSTSRKARLSSSQKGLTFEHKCMQVIQSMGFSAHSTKIVADGGIDIVALSNQPLTRGKYVIQCKNWKKPVGEPIVRDLYGVVASDNAVKGILISSSRFTQSAVNFAKDKRLELIDGHQLDYLSSLVTEKE
jgi:HJR/Mrr/RecB family endonuclease